LYLGSMWRYEVGRSDGTMALVDVPAGTPLLDVGAACAIGVVAGRVLHRLE
jgi:hypothetical protein